MSILDYIGTGSPSPLTEDCRNIEVLYSFRKKVDDYHVYAITFTTTDKTKMGNRLLWKVDVIKQWTYFYKELEKILGGKLEYYLTFEWTKHKIRPCIHAHGIIVYNKSSAFEAGLRQMLFKVFGANQHDIDTIRDFDIWTAYMTKENNFKDLFNINI